MSRATMPSLLTPALVLLALAGAAQSTPTVQTPSAPAPTPAVSRLYQLYQLPDGTRLFGPNPLTPAQKRPLVALALPPAAPPFPHGPGDIIPPCIISYGFTTRGLTDQYGHLLQTPTRLPRWTDVKQNVFE